MPPADSSNRLRRLLHPLYRRLETSVHPLRYLFVEITQRCNLHCRHCGSDCGRETQRRELSTEEWLRFFFYLGERLDRRRMVLVLTGGEPFCHPEFERLLSGIRQCRLAFGMVTNGFALSPANLRLFLDAGGSSMTVSLDGLQRTHDWLRGVNGSFDRALRGIEHAAALGLPFFDVVTCVHPGNLEELPAMMALLQERKVAAWRLFPIFPKGRTKKNPTLLLSPAQFSDMLDFIRQARLQCQGSGFSLQFCCEGYLPSDLDHQVRDEPYFCRAGISIGSVLCDGSISACPNISRTLIQGNIRQDDFVEVWHKRFVPFRQRGWMKQGDCRECKSWSRCLGNSLHLWDEEQGRTARCTLEMCKR